MNLHSCTKSEFLCKNGKCVDFKKRCDKQFDCLEYPDYSDFSDEQDCSAIILPPVYDKRVPPPPVFVEGNQNKLTIINMTVHIINIVEVIEIQSKFEMRFKLSTSWNDHRLTFNSLHEDNTKNVIGNTSEIWMPKIRFTNVVLPHTYNLVETDSLVTARKIGNGILFNDEIEKYYYLYKKQKHILTRSSSYAAAFICNFENISQYPFDKETCTAKMIIAGSQYDFLQLMPLRMLYTGLIKDVNNSTQHLNFPRTFLGTVYHVMNFFTAMDFN